MVCFFSFSLAISIAADTHREIWWPEKDHPGPDPKSAPPWLLSDKLCFSRWDGGRIEVSKGFLSGWTYFNPPWPDVVDATNRWYDPDTLGLAVKMGYGFLWLTMSNGFSLEQEAGHHQALKRYVEECHERGIKVAAYQSLTNIFTDDMFERVPESKNWLLLGVDGKPMPYGAAHYQKLGRVTRVLADVSRPEWRAYLKKRVDLAIDLGFDALEWDNVFYSVGGDERSKQRYTTFLARNQFCDNADVRSLYELEQLRRVFRDLLAHARRRKPEVVIFCNLHRSTFTVGRATTILTSEDGREPGIYDITPARQSGRGDIKDADVGDLAQPVYADEPLDIAGEPFSAERLRTNLGVLRCLKGLSEGWKPVLLEYGGRRNGDRFLNQMPPLAFQLSVAECNAALCGFQGFQEGRALLDLYRRRPEVMRIVEAASAVHRFVREQAKYVVGAEYKTDVAIVADARMRASSFCDRLARANVQYEVLFEDRIHPEVLRRYQRVLVPDTQLLSDQAVRSLVAFAEQGGRLMVTGNTGAMTDWGQPRGENPLGRPGPWTYRRKDVDEAESIRFLTEGIKSSFEIPDCPYVLFVLTQGAGVKPGGFVAHLLNYRKHPLTDVRIRCPAGKQVHLLALTPGCNRIQSGRQDGEWLIPSLGVYSLVIVD
jgi:hypothetical protein